MDKRPDWLSGLGGADENVVDRFDQDGRLVHELDKLVPTEQSDLQYKTLRGGNTSEAGVLAGNVVRLVDRWATGLPAEVMQATYRRISTAGTDIFGAGSYGTFERTILTLEQGMSFILLDLRQVWLQCGDDPSDPDALTALNDYHAAYGKVGFELLFNGALPVDARESAAFRDVSAATDRTVEVAGFTVLNQNILDMGMQPVAWYAKDSTRITARWRVAQSGDVPDVDYTPTTVLVQLRGYMMPTKVFNEILARIRRG